MDFVESYLVSTCLGLSHTLSSAKPRVGSSHGAGQIWAARVTDFEYECVAVQVRFTASIWQHAQILCAGLLLGFIPSPSIVEEMTERIV